MNKKVSSLTFRPLKYLPTYLQKCNTRSQYVYEITRCRLNRWGFTPPWNHTIAPQPTTNHLPPPICITFQEHACQYYHNWVQHASDGMVNANRRKCRAEGCGKMPSLWVAGTKNVEYCAQHAPDGMINVKSRKCRTEGCGKQPSYGVAGTETADYCCQHAPDGMVDVYSRKCKTEDCGKQPSYGMAAPKTVEYCCQHVQDGIIDVYCYEPLECFIGIMEPRQDNGRRQRHVSP